MLCNDILYISRHVLMIIIIIMMMIILQSIYKAPFKTQLQSAFQNQITYAKSKKN